jgi:hypothetical protein
VGCASRGLVSDTPCRKSEVVAPCFGAHNSQGADLVPAMPVRCGCVALRLEESITTSARQAHTGQRVGHDTESPYPQHKTWERARRPRARDAACARASAHDARGGQESRGSDRVETSEQRAVVHVSTSHRAYKNRPAPTRRTTATTRRPACPCKKTLWGLVRRRGPIISLRVCLTCRNLRMEGRRRNGRKRD